MRNFFLLIKGLDCGGLDINKKHENKNPSSLLYEGIRSLLIGILIVGPVLALVMVVFQYIIG